jgi:hypothetical protein
MDDEIWKKIVGYEKYSVSSYGRIRQDKFNRILKTWKQNRGYYIVDIGKTMTVHRLVLSTFVENTDNKTDVDHINRNREDNRLVNLRWTTHRENIGNRGGVFDKESVSAIKPSQ